MSRNSPITLMLTIFLILSIAISTANAADDDVEKDLSNELALIESWLDGQRVYYSNPQPKM